MTRTSGTLGYEVRFEEGGDLPIFIDHLQAHTIESGIYLVLATNLPQLNPGKADPTSSAHATLYLPLGAIEALHRLSEDYRRHIGGGETTFTGEQITLRFDRPRSDVPVLADFFNCSEATSGIHLSVGRLSTTTPNVAVVFATYLLTRATMLKLHWLTSRIVELVRRPPGYVAESSSSH
ncbi:hypothetical protein BHAOGJBA_1386 [Methylobacterium hispanicum]|uniref:DUF2867 domain-containing protein n=1 Tax=Methylobacterium hispanicum TaxID=270350 RepID=A0AAV4ZIM8_9HYPH|nr:hypothetical protein [Methylobacterium hispanicum]GJD87880.1 hypothetical protein BHAOGJBA_1386 [Methylobacterium hispanicum]